MPEHVVRPLTGCSERLPAAPVAEGYADSQGEGTGAGGAIGRCPAPDPAAPETVPAPLAAVCAAWTYPVVTR